MESAVAVDLDREDARRLEPERVGVRELRGNSTGYLRRVRPGGSFLVTSHDQVLAEAHPPPAPNDRAASPARCAAGSGWRPTSARFRRTCSRRWREIEIARTKRYEPPPDAPEALERIGKSYTLQPFGSDPVTDPSAMKQMVLGRAAVAADDKGIDPTVTAANAGDEAGQLRLTG